MQLTQTNAAIAVSAVFFLSVIMADITERTFEMNGLALHTVLFGAGRPLLLLHGFTGSAATWAGLAAQLAPQRQCIALDLIGHGKSGAPADPARYTMDHAVQDIAGLLDVLGISRVDLLGYSLGGRLALQFAVAAPGRVRALILESASPGLASPAERAARIAADDALAEVIERDGIEAFVAHWEALPLWASQAELPAELRARQRTQRLANRPQGLANSLRGMGTGRQRALWDMLPTLTIPTLLLAGALDAKFSAIAQQMAATLPRADLAIIAAAGHAIHLEQPEIFGQRVAVFLEQQVCT
jgi:2-succinyl-6-hydroxy-2,4-cyclohexadiene-1-carboxylate synthase